MPNLSLSLSLSLSLPPTPPPLSLPLSFSLSLYLSVVPPMIQTVHPVPGQMVYTVNETETVTFQCSATGIPGPSISWSRNGVELSGPRVMFGDSIPTNISRGSDGEYVWLVNRTIQLANTRDDDSGTYTCNATNSAGDDYEPFELIVQSKLNRLANNIPFQLEPKTLGAFYGTCLTTRQEYNIRPCKLHSFPRLA